MTGLRSTSQPRRVARCIGVAEGDQEPATARRSTARRPADAIEEPRAAELREHLPSVVARRSARGGATTSSRTSARTPPMPTSTSGPNCGSRRAPTISSTPAARHRLDEDAVGVVAPGRPRRARRSAAASALRPAMPSSTPPTSRLVGEARAHRASSPTGQPRRSAAAVAALEHRGGVDALDRDRLDHRQAGRAQQLERFALRDDAAAGAAAPRSGLRRRVRGASRPRAGSAPPARASSSRTGPRATRWACRRSHQASRGDRAEARSRCRAGSGRRRPRPSAPRPRA